MIEVFTSNTPNGKKITIMLEEIDFKYKITKININKDEQFEPEFQKISPFRKIPVIIDHDKNSKENPLKNERKAEIIIKNKRTKSKIK